MDNLDLRSIKKKIKCDCIELRSLHLTTIIIFSIIAIIVVFGFYFLSKGNTAEFLQLIKIPILAIPVIIYKIVKIISLSRFENGNYEFIHGTCHNIESVTWRLRIYECQCTTDEGDEIIIYVSNIKPDVKGGDKVVIARIWSQSLIYRV